MTVLSQSLMGLTVLSHFAAATAARAAAAAARLEPTAPRLPPPASNPDAAQARMTAIMAECARLNGQLAIFTPGDAASSFVMAMMRNLMDEAAALAAPTSPPALPSP